MFEWTRIGENTFILVRKDRRLGDLARIQWTGKSWTIEVLGRMIKSLADPVSAKASAELRLAQEFHDMMEALDNM